MTDPSTFDPAGPLPAGRVVLEASAGTGKTWTIAALTTRYIAEQAVPVDQILVVTFTRAATSELRERVRSRLIEAGRFLRSNSNNTEDPVLTSLADTSPDERKRRADRLQQAIAGFDQATITTLHGFAHRLLRELGFLAATPPTLDVAANWGDLVDEALTDLIIQRFADRTAIFPDVDELQKIADTVLTNPDAGIVPDPKDAHGSAAQRGEFAQALRTTVADRSEEAGIVTYDDLLIRARRALTHPTVAAIARTLMDRRFQVALVDEFQDTDRIQWDIVNSLFPSDTSTMVIIGDPKQSIYAFRGADVAAYLHAAADSEVEHTLSTNWRSDGPLITALDHLFTGVTFGDDRIPYRPVSPAPGREGSRIRGVQAPVDIRFVGRQSPVSQIKKGTLSVPAARQFIADDTAAYIVGLLTGPAEINDDRWHEVRPGDIAVLCRTGQEVELTKQGLATRSVPAVVGRTGSVFTSTAAEHWLTLLAALEYPSSTRRVRALALSPFVGWTTAELLAADDDDLLPLHDQVTVWAQTLDSSGVPALWKTIEQAHQVTERILSDPDGERLATDLDHLTEVLHSARRSGARSLHDWLIGEIQRAATESEDDDIRARRLETDADAVQVLTIHAAKGLEFPVVLCPFLWNTKNRSPDVPVYHPPGSDRRLIGVGGSDWDGFDDAKQIAEAEGAAEEMRLMYVALTRARHHNAVWWAACDGAKTALLSRLLFGRTSDGSAVKDQVAIVSDERLSDHVKPLVDRSAGTIAFTPITAQPSTQEWESTEAPAPNLTIAEFGRNIDFTWRRTSFTGLTTGAHRPSIVPDPETDSKADEPELPPVEEASPVGNLPLGDVAGGTRFGTLVHHILERVDFTLPDLRQALTPICSEEIARHSLDIDPDRLADALSRVATTPLFPGDDSTRLCDIPRQDQLAEMDFEMGCFAPNRPIHTSDLAQLLRDHLSDDDPLREYADRLDTLGSSQFRGYLTGAIDLVMRIGSDQQYWVVDYKTNRLNRITEPASIADYTPTSLAEAMIDGNYVLQSLIYQVALHRYLQFRIPDYKIETHLGGSLYLFIRGMIGPDTPASADGRFGVAEWTPPPTLITAVSDLFDHGPAS